MVGEVPYMGYTELCLKIPEVSNFKQDVLILVVPSTNYNQMVPVTIRTLHIDMILELATKEELKTLSKQWRRGLVNRKGDFSTNVVRLQKLLNILRGR